jgi:hypothetical protein
MDLEALERSSINGVDRAIEQELIIRWARHEYKVDGWVVPSYTMNGRMYGFIIDSDSNEDYETDDRDFATFERAQAALVQALVKIIKEIRKNG